MGELASDGQAQLGPVVFWCPTAAEAGRAPVLLSPQGEAHMGDKPEVAAWE